MLTCKQISYRHLPTDRISLIADGTTTNCVETSRVRLSTSSVRDSISDKRNYLIERGALSDRSLGLKVSV